MIVVIAQIHGGADYIEPSLQTTLDGLRLPTDGHEASHRA
jgi:hypothetical protein